MDSLRGVALQRAAQAERAWTQRVGAFVRLPQLIRELGADPDLVLRDVGLSPASFSHPDNRVPYVAYVDVLHAATDHTHCPHLGLLAGNLFDLGGLGVVGDLIRNCRSVGQALEALLVYQHINSEGGLAFLLRQGEFVDLGYAMYHPGTRGGAPMHDATLAAGMNFMVQLCGPTWRPYEVLLARAKPASVDPYRHHFKVAPRFDCEYSALRFAAADLGRKVLDADPELYRQAERRLRSVSELGFLQQVYRGLRRLMLENRHSGDDLAHMLSMHRRTLNRRLQAEGTTFQAVLDDVRYQVARDLLANTEVPLDDIAATLGYAGLTPFMRSFRRWSNATPGQWRRMMQGHHGAPAGAGATPGADGSPMRERAQGSMPTARPAVQIC